MRRQGNRLTVFNMAANAQLMGFGINTKAVDEIAKLCVLQQQRQRPLVMACANPHSLVTAKKDTEFATALTKADFLIADGVGVTLALKFKGLTEVPRITGHDFFCTVHQNFAAEFSKKLLGRKPRVFFFGSSQQVLDKLSVEFATTYPDLELCGTLSPPYGDWSAAANDAMIEKINQAQPDIIWVGMTAPKQEKWVELNKHKLNAKVIGSIGAVFDFVAGTYPRAPEWACRLGIEWLVRLLKEPKRLWRRTFVSAPIFACSVLFR